MNIFFSNIGLMNIAVKSGRRAAVLRSSSLTTRFLTFLYNNGLIAGFELIPYQGFSSELFKLTRVFLKTCSNRPVFFSIEPLSTPSRLLRKPQGFVQSRYSRSGYFVCVSNSFGFSFIRNGFFSSKNINFQADSGGLLFLKINVLFL